MTVPQDMYSWAVAGCPLLGKDKKRLISIEKVSFAQCSHTLWAFTNRNEALLLICSSDKAKPFRQKSA